jgi:hypothetical protein
MGVGRSTATRRAVALLVAALAGVLFTSGVTPASPEPAQARPTATSAPEPPRFTFVSSPDFMNADVANLRTYRNWRATRRHWRARFPGKPVPNSWNRSYRAALRTTLDGFAAERPDARLVAGDLVNGHWGEDEWTVRGRRVRTGIFGPTRTHHERTRARLRAANFYFSRYRRMFDRTGIALYPAMGDHEYGDDSWSGPGNRFKRATMHVVKRPFRRHLTSGLPIDSRPRGPATRTAYATHLHPDLLLVTLDEFRRAGGRVVGEIDDRQLSWLRRVLRSANQRGTRWIIVQGHLPILPQAAYRGSSALCYTKGARSALWRTLDRFDVDLYLNGEVHQNSRRTRDGVTQISHGGLFGFGFTRGNTSYLLGRVYGDRLELTAKRFRVTWADRRGRLYQVSPGALPWRRKRVAPRPERIGRLTLTDGSGAGHGAGVLAPYAGNQRCGKGRSFRGHGAGVLAPYAGNQRCGKGRSFRSLD